MTVSAFEQISTFYPSPGGSSEQIFLYYAEVSGEFAKYNKQGDWSKKAKIYCLSKFHWKMLLTKLKRGRSGMQRQLSEFIGWKTDN